MKCTALLATILAAAGAAHARGGEAFFFFTVTTDDGDAVIEPDLGESSCLITLSCRMEWDGQGNRFEVFGGALLNILGDDQAARGRVAGYTINSCLDLLGGDTTEVVGEDLMNGTFINYCAGQSWDDANPIDMIWFTWETTDLAARTIEYATDNSLGIISVLAYNSKGRLISENWPAHDGQLFIDIVPTPSAAAIVVGLLAAARRRRTDT